MLFRSRNIGIDYRWAAADPERIRSFAGELVSLKPDVLLAQSTPVTVALRKETSSLPIVFVQVADPVGSGVVADLAHPVGNITGFTNFEYTMSCIHELLAWPADEPRQHSLAELEYATPPPPHSRLLQAAGCGVGGRPPLFTDRQERDLAGF